jgi:predicted aldo/keto reductase-like oxidoreductase
MQYRKLGTTGIDVSIIGLGTEHLEHSPLDEIISVVDTALNGGISYFDLFMASPDVRDNFGIALKNRRQRVMIAGHLGATLKNDQYNRSRDKALCEHYFNDLLKRLHTDYIDVLMLHYVDETDDYEKAFNPEDGLLELALRLQKEGKARMLGMSSHRVPVSLQAVNSGYIDLLMFPVNPATDTLPGDIEIEAAFQASTYKQSRTETGATSRRELHHACAARGVGIVAMKPYAAGWLFTKGNPSSIVLTPVQCLSYALSQAGVCTVVPGCRTANEVKTALAYLEATTSEKDFSAIDTNSIWKLQGSCMYCNHCLPCPVSIDIAAVTRLTDTAQYDRDDRIVSEYKALPVTASACTECGVCKERCPFQVDVVCNMKRAATIFGR